MVDKAAITLVYDTAYYLSWELALWCVDPLDIGSRCNELWTNGLAERLRLLS